MFRNKKNKISSAFFITSLLASLAVLLVSCAAEAPALPDTYTVQKGSIIQTVTSSGSVDSSDKKNYSLSVAGEVLKSLKKGEYFKKGDILIEVSNDRAQILIRQAEESLKAGDISIEIARINYQKALDSNHVAIQLIDLNTKKAQEAAASALLSLGNANRSADQAYESAISSLENTKIISNLSVESAQSALDEAQRILEEAKAANPATTVEKLAVYEYNVKTAKQRLEQAKAEQLSNISNAEDNIGSSDIQNSNSLNSAQKSYDQTLNEQSSTYWNNLSSLESAQAQMKITQKNIAQAENQLALSRINLELATLDINKNKLTAPYDGIVLESNFSNGVYAGPGPAISIISSVFEVKSDINETDISKVKVGQDVDITLDAFPEQNFLGKVSSIAPISKNTAGIITFEVTVTPDDNKNPSFMYGISANLEIATLKIENVLLVPADSVYEENGKKYVDAIDISAAESSKAFKKVEVTTGASDYNNTEILTGLKEGDVIYASPVPLPDAGAKPGGIRGMFGGMGG